MKVIVSEKGQVTIPKRLRDRLGIRPGAILDFEEDAGKLVATKSGVSDPVDELYGSLRLDKTSDELLEDLRGSAELP